MQYIVLILALFQGHVVDKPEQTMMETKYSTRGQVEHKVSPSYYLCSALDEYFVGVHDWQNPFLSDRVEVRYTR